MGDTILTIIIFVGIIIMARAFLVGFKRDMHNHKRALFEVRDVNDIAQEEEFMRSAKGMMKELNKQEIKENKKQGKKAGSLPAGGASTGFCANCGNALKQGARFCTKCGTMV